MGRSFAGILATASVISAAIIASITFNVGIGTNLLVSDTTTTTTLCLGTECRTTWPTGAGTSSWYGPIEWSSATGTNTTSTNLYATNLGAFNIAASSIIFTNATGTNLTATTGIFTNLCLTGDDCITSWPSGAAGEIPQLTQVLNAGNHATTTFHADMGFTATSGTIADGTSTAWDTTRLGWTNGAGTYTTTTVLSWTSATGTSLFATSGGFTSLRTSALTANGTGATSTNFYVSGTGLFNRVGTTSFTANSTGATSTNLYISGTGIFNRIGTTSFKANSTGATTTNWYVSANSIIGKITMTNATGTSLYASSYTGGTLSVTSVTSTSIFATSLGWTNAAFTNATGTSLSLSSLLIGGKRTCREDGLYCLKTVVINVSTSTEGFMQTGTTSSQMLVWPYPGTWTVVAATATLAYSGTGGTSTQLDVRKSNGTANVSLFDRWLHIDDDELDSDGAVSTVTISGANGTLTKGDRIVGSILALPTTKSKGAVIEVQVFRSQ